MVTCKQFLETIFLALRSPFPPKQKSLWSIPPMEAACSAIAHWQPEALRCRATDRCPGARTRGFFRFPIHSGLAARAWAPDATSSA